MKMIVASPPHFVYNFLRKMFVIVYSIKEPNYMVWLFLLLAIHYNIWIVIISCSACDVIIFQINLNFLFEPFLYKTKKSGQKCKCFKNKKTFHHEIKVILINFKGLSLIQMKATLLEGEIPNLKFPVQ